MTSNHSSVSISLHPQTVNDDTSMQYTLSEQNRLQTSTGNTSLQHGCFEIRFDEMEYLPWDNPDNILTVEAELTVYRIKNNILGLLFLIGGPANVINMAVFAKQGLKDRVNVCLFALSLADELYLIGAMLRHGEQLHIQFTTQERFGPMATFLVNINLVVLASFLYVSPILSAIIACERCVCVISPLKFQTLLRARTMAVTIIAINVIVFGLFFIVAFRYRIGCFYEPTSGAILVNPILGEFYQAHKEFIDFLESFVFGVALPGVVLIVVISTTIVTTVKLRQIVTWRADSSSALSPREIALTKMLIGNSVFFIVCVFPVALIRFSWFLFPEVNAGRRNQNLFLTSVWITEVFSLINATFNIFVYYVMGSRYRETFWALFRRNSQPGQKRHSEQQQ